MTARPDPIVCAAVEALCLDRALIADQADYLRALLAEIDACDRIGMTTAGTTDLIVSWMPSRPVRT